MGRGVCGTGRCACLSRRSACRLHACAWRVTTRSCSATAGRPPPARPTPTPMRPCSMGSRGCQRACPARRPEPCATLAAGAPAIRAIRSRCRRLVVAHELRRAAGLSGRRGAPVPGRDRDRGRGLPERRAGTRERLDVRSSRAGGRGPIEGKQRTGNPLPRARPAAGCAPPPPRTLAHTTGRRRQPALLSHDAARPAARHRAWPGGRGSVAPGATGAPPEP